MLHLQRNAYKRSCSDCNTSLRTHRKICVQIPGRLAPDHADHGTSMHARVHASSPHQQEPRLPESQANPQPERPLLAQQGQPSEAHQQHSSGQSNAAHALTSAGQGRRIPHVSFPQVLEEVRDGVFWSQCKAVLPQPPWGPTQLVQVMVAGAAGACVALLANVASAPGGPLSQAALVSVFGSEMGGERLVALRHLALEGAALLLTVAVLSTALKDTKPLAKGMFSYQLNWSWVRLVSLLCLVAFPAIDLEVASGWRSALSTLLGPQTLVNPGGDALVASVSACSAHGDQLCVAAHLLASSVLGPAWEETFWRGFFLASLSRVLPLPACMAVSSLGFAALHLTPANALPILMLAPLGDALYLRSGSLAPPLILHTAWNASQLLAVAYLGKEVFV